MNQSRKHTFKDKIDSFIFGKLVDQPRWELEKALIGHVNSVLDLGCGAHSDIGYFKKQLERTVGVDLFLPSINISQENQLHHEYYKIDILSEFLPTYLVNIFLIFE